MERMRVTWDWRQEEQRGMEDTALVASEAGEITQELRLYRWLGHNRLSDLIVNDKLIRKKLEK